MSNNPVVDCEPTILDNSNSDELLSTWLSVDYERRRYRRWQINQQAEAKHHGAQVACLVCDISPSGASVEFDGAERLAINDKIVLLLNGPTPLVAEVRSFRDGRLGLSFLHDIQGEQLLAQWMTHEENTRRQLRRQSFVSAAILHVAGQTYPCSTQNISLGGAKIEGEAIDGLDLGDEIALELADIEPIRGYIRYKVQHSMGIKFDHTPISLKSLTDWIAKTQDQIDANQQ